VKWAETGVADIGLLAAGLAVGIMFLRMIQRRRRDLKHAVDGCIRESPWSLADVAAVLLFTAGGIIAGLTVTVAARLLNREGDVVGPLGQLLAGAAIFPFPTTVGIAFVAVRRGIIPGKMGFRLRYAVSDALIGLLAALAVLPLVIAASLPVEIMVPRMKPSEDMQPVMSLVLGGLGGGVWETAVMVVTAGIAVPAAEELFFRGLLLPVVGKQYGARTAVIVVSLIFAAIHFHARSFLPLFVLAACLSAAFFYTRSIVVPIAMHCGFNLIQIARGLTLVQG